MTSLFDFSKQIASLKEKKKYSEALSYFKINKQNYDPLQIKNNEYIISDIISCLRYTNQYEQGLLFLELYKIPIDSIQKERVILAYGWLLWAMYKENNRDEPTHVDVLSFEEFNQNEVKISYLSKSNTLQKIKLLIPILLQKNSDFSKTLISNLFSSVLNLEKKKKQPDWKLINDFCDLFSPTVLSKETSSIQIKRKGRIKDMELSSDLESWYAYKTKALLKLGKWQTCFELSKEALANIDTFHYSNDIWFSRRIALSMKNLGNIDDTINELEKILQKKNEWFIQKELAELYFEKNEINSAFKMATEAINSYGPIEFKVDLLLLLGRILMEKNQLDIAFKHISLSKLIRQKKEWKLSQSLITELAQFKNDEIPISEIDTLMKEVINFSRKHDRKQTNIKIMRNPDNSSYIGEIVKILHDNNRGKDGFIKYTNQNLYFSLSINFPLIDKLSTGSKVRFSISPSRNGNKNYVTILKIIE
ncbi:DUF7017 domain-containing protein [Plebeiibacterium sediminum]|uniref:Tetratricopeptide repeat protein n=1 Tax=Plebeiibacterium sediminum TaxID=2992112 RepID=A0AAE3SHF8_9BACT|nr:hypothetical protein [Plebeiobacterium sediminum]MCW3789361.1 hypothetical protein [Plebeiobacterium sediminum]